jgi:histidyl-tRNA synthetase
MKHQRPRGTADIFGRDVQIWNKVEGAFVEVMEAYGYGEIRTPAFESTELFERSVGEQTDIVTKEMYTFQDKGGRSLTLRPENTAGVVRAYLEAGLVRRPGVVKLYYLGPMFRYEKPQAGRFRQFHQAGCEALGSPSPVLDAEVIEMVMAVFDRLGFENLEVVVNSVGDAEDRPRYVEYLREEIRSRGEAFCPTCRERAGTNPMRVFDCKEDSCRRELEGFRTILDFLSKSNRTHLDRVLSALGRLGVTYRVDGRLVRGLDYYTRTAFEVHSPDLGAQSALCGGGRYDDLVRLCGGPDTPATGFSAGLERIVQAMRSREDLNGEDLAPVQVYVIPLGEEALEPGLELARAVRRRMVVEVDYTLRPLKKQLGNASRREARWAVLLGEEELADGSAVVKDLDTGEQQKVKLDQVEKELERRDHHD